MKEIENILAIDPGNKESGWIEVSTEDGFGIVDKGVFENGDLLDHIGSHWRNKRYVVEMIGHYGTGMPAGREVFDTCIWIGRIMQSALWANPWQPIKFVLRPTIKAHLCGSAKAKDANVRQALLDRLGPQGTKKNPGPTYGIKSHMWSALAVAVTAYDLWDQLEEVE